MYSFLGRAMTPTVPSWEPSMQRRKAVPLIDPKAPFVGTGMEYQKQPMTQGGYLHNMVMGYLCGCGQSEVRREDGL